MEIDVLKTCLREPLQEIFDAARHLEEAVSAHVRGRTKEAADLIRKADIPAIAEWSESLWGKGGPWTRPLPVANPLRFVAKEERLKSRMPSSAQRDTLLARDGLICRFCGIPVVLPETRMAIREAYPDALRWGPRNADQHAGFQAMWLQPDHLIPHARGGNNDLDNLIVSCAPCNCGRSNLTLEEAGLADPRSRNPVSSTWDGLKGFVTASGAKQPRSRGRVLSVTQRP